ncbi:MULTISPECIES: hypothetical protein [unclassified Streptomyces]|uniref:hypothetical protein n=1 Tax=unclassified Streptomyces TaxID=2593676 RepID=UPI001EF04DA4|nr:MULTISPECIES: hypothetical protein [unclassified Streptomyces]
MDWGTQEELATAVANLLESGVDPSNLPHAIRHYETVQTCMRDAVLQVLTSAGFQAARADMHTYGSAVHVEGAHPLIPLVLSPPDELVGQGRPSPPPHEEGAMTERAPEAVLRPREQLASDVFDVLEAAGFTVHQEGRSPAEPRGVLLSVDPSEGLEGGVFVRWNVAHALSRAAMESARREGTQARTFQHYGFVTAHMHETLISVLTSAGFLAADVDSEMDPYLIRVVR